MRELKIFLSVAIMLAVVWIFTQNATPVELKLFGAVYPNIPLYIIILVSLSLGMLLGFAITLVQNMRLRRGLRLLDRERAKLKEEVDKRRMAVLDNHDAGEEAIEEVSS